MMKFSANISTLFNNVPSLLDRYLKVLETKFERIECQNPYNHTIEEWQSTFDSVKNETKDLPKFDLINSIPVFSIFKNRIPNVTEFDQQILETTLKYAKFLKVKKVHLVLTDSHSSDDLKSILNLLKHGAKRLNEHNIICVIEPLSIRKFYYLRCYLQAKSFLEQLNEPNLKILIDSYHMQMLNGNLTTIVNELKNETGHVQISQVPLRDSPINTGEINFDYFLNLISKGYSDYVGLEYNAPAEERFDWLEKFKNN